ncbi:trypsin-like peptidase domain-containing protein [Dysgonomonas sp. ZJ709]|uniref:trypsin-like peptidase domain-containing protein n=1 Tax=Dysgonomonas sp. ZJ709 TaxID=2709797 RepID=UPI0013EB6655|nr:trypsin-like peptidase domain-containing protein [Dysgonomonas sp. ZJ709]
MRNNSVNKLLLGLFLLFSLNISAQQTAHTFNSDKSVVTLQIDVDKARLDKEDEMAKQIGTPMRIAILYPLFLDAISIGKWDVLSNSKKTWKLTIEAPKSHGVTVRYDDFYIPQGGTLYVYNEDSSYDTKVYAHKSNPNGGFYSTETLSGDKITLEYVTSSDQTEMPRFQISSIGYKYRDLSDVFVTPDSKLRSFNDSRNVCIPNINCPEGDEWQNQKKGVVRLLTTIGSSTYFCSGTLVNNANKDKTPYLLSAYHCFNVNGRTATMERTEIYFDDEFVTCENQTTRPESKKLIGAESLVMNPIVGGSDGALIKLTQEIDPAWKVHYNGWDTENQDYVNLSGAVIQHPLGDVKKIALFTTPLVTTSWAESEGSSAPNAHWLVRYSRGVTQGGSSGSPIFNQNGLVVGTLTGGSSSCTNTSATDSYGKFAYHWNKSSDPDLWMKKYLDPNNTGITKLSGMDSSGATDPDPQPIDRPNVVVFWDGEDLYVTAKDILKTVRVYNLSGYEVYSQREFSSSTHRIPTSAWNRGVYIVSVDAQSGISKTKKVVK